jgi:hypothetical protein
VATGTTKKQVEENIYDAVKFHLEGLREEGIPLPEQHTESERKIRDSAIRRFGARQSFYPFNSEDFFCINRSRKWL